MSDDEDLTLQPEVGTVEPDEDEMFFFDPSKPFEADIDPEQDWWQAPDEQLPSRMSSQVVMSPGEETSLNIACCLSHIHNTTKTLYDFALTQLYDRTAKARLQDINICLKLDFL